MKVVLTEEAERDLEESVSYLLERNPPGCRGRLELGGRFRTSMIPMS